MMNYYLSVMPGLAGVVADELWERHGLKAGSGVRVRNAELEPVAGAGQDGPVSDASGRR